MVSFVSLSRLSESACLNATETVEVATTVGPPGAAEPMSTRGAGMILLPCNAGSAQTETKEVCRLAERPFKTGAGPSVICDSGLLP